MYKSEELFKKWSKVLEETGTPITEEYRKTVTAVLLENQRHALKEANESSVAGTATGNVAKWDPILISLVRRAAPNMIAFDIAGVQPMTGPTGLIFALRAKYIKNRGGNAVGSEALFLEADSAFAGIGTHEGDTSGFQTGDPSGPATGTSYGTGMPVATGEALGTATNNQFAEMGLTIDKTTVEAKTRALKAEYSIELAQDLKAIHGLDAESELAAILSNEVVAEINREFIRTINVAATLTPAQTGTGQSNIAGYFDVQSDADGRWSVEKWKGLLYHIERQCNGIAKDTRRGRGNFILCSSDVASALGMAGILDFAPELNTNLIVDDTGNTFVGTINGRLKVYIDPYATTDYVTIGYRGASAWDAGVFYCPYVPLQMVKAIGEDSFQPKIGFKTRYGIKANPFARGLNIETNTGDEGLAANSNVYYRKMRVVQLL